MNVQGGDDVVPAPLHHGSPEDHVVTTPTTGQRSGSGRIVVGVDGSPSSEEALRWAVEQARLTGQPVHALTSWTYPLDYGAPEIDSIDWEGNSTGVLENTVAKVLDRSDADRVTQQVVEGHPARVLLDAAADADLLVVGSRGHGGFAGMLLGSVSQHVVAHATCPVVVVHASVNPPAGPPR
jgi:nucleotide-binding universal stress UspA family protein